MNKVIKLFWPQNLHFCAKKLPCFLPRVTIGGGTVVEHSTHHPKVWCSCSATDTAADTEIDTYLNTNLSLANWDCSLLSSCCTQTSPKRASLLRRGVNDVLCRLSENGYNDWPQECHNDETMTRQWPWPAAVKLCSLVIYDLALSVKKSFSQSKPIFFFWKHKNYLQSIQTKII